MAENGNPGALAGVTGAEMSYHADAAEKTELAETCDARDSVSRLRIAFLTRAYGRERVQPDALNLIDPGVRHLARGLTSLNAADPDSLESVLEGMRSWPWNLMKRRFDLDSFLRVVGGLVQRRYGRLRDDLLRMMEWLRDHHVAFSSVVPWPSILHPAGFTAGSARGWRHALDTATDWTGGGS